MNQIDKHGSHYGIIYAIAAYGSWGLFPLYFKTVPAEVLAHRALWFFAVLAVLVAFLGGGRNWDVNCGAASCCSCWG